MAAGFGRQVVSHAWTAARGGNHRSRRTAAGGGHARPRGRPRRPGARKSSADANLADAPARDALDDRVDEVAVGVTLLDIDDRRVLGFVDETLSRRRRAMPHGSLAVAV
jgi:hypothetical protein